MTSSGELEYCYEPSSIRARSVSAEDRGSIPFNNILITHLVMMIFISPKSTDTYYTVALTPWICDDSVIPHPLRPTVGEMSAV